MRISRKIAFVFFVSIGSMAILNIIAFYTLYSLNITRYLSEKIDSRQEITLEYVNSLVERQTLDELEQIFSESELEFFELLDTSWGVIALDNDRNINIVIDFLVKSGISPRYLEEIIPENNLEKVLASLRDTESPEALFVHRLVWGLIITNIFFLTIIWVWVYMVSQKTIRPLQKVTKTLTNYKLGERFEPIEYGKNDEIGLLIQAINTLNRKLSLQDSIRTRLIADISHELKTPITSIQCYLEWISDGVIQLDPKVLDTLSGEMKRLTKLVNMILEYQKFESRSEIVEKISFSPHRVIEDIILHTQKKLEKNKQKVYIVWSEHIELYAEKDLFIQLVYNIIGNFIKYAGKNTELYIELQAQKIIFRDNGKGISKHELPYVFEKFYQGKKEKTGNAENRGIGVGLSMVKKICELHNWKITLESDTLKGFILIIETDPQSFT